MKYFAVFFFTLFTTLIWAQEKTTLHHVSGTVVDGNDSKPLPNVNIININTVKGSITNSKGYFEINAQANDTLHISILGYQPLKVKVTNDWIKNKNTQIRLTEKAYALEEVIIRPFVLTGYLEIDSKLIGNQKDNYRYDISGLSKGYEVGEYSPNAFSRTVGSLFNPADALYNLFGKKPKELKRLKEMKKDDTVRNLLESKFDRETLCALLGVTKSEISDILEHCNYSQAFIQTANDLQILDAISGCYEEYKMLKRK